MDREGTSKDISANFFIGTDNNVMFRIWARKDALDQIAYAKDVGPKMLEYFEEYFNVTYPLPKQDMIAIPDFRSVYVFI
jgi:aminopeptidase N